MSKIFSRSHWVKAAMSVCGLMSVPQAIAAPVGVTATINPGTACTPSLTNADLDYGAINTSELNKDKPTALTGKPVTLNVACAPLASKFFFRIIDRTPNTPSIQDNLGPTAGVPDSEVYSTGMGMGVTPDNRPIGELFLKSTAILADAQNKIILHSNGGGDSPITGGGDWQKRGSDFIFGNRSGIRRYAVADPVSQMITAAKSFTIQMEAIPVIDHNAIGGLSGDTRLDSKFTIEVTQL